MMFYGLSKEDIKRAGSLINDQYVFNLGEQIEVDSLKSSSSRATAFLSTYLAETKSDDGLTLTYKPSNKVFFDKSLIDSNCSLDNVSLHINKEEGKVIIGRYSDYEFRQGVLALSGELSLNGYLKYHRPLYFSAKAALRASQNVSVLSVGQLGDDLFGLYLVPIKVGIAVGEVSEYDDSDCGFSVKNMKLRDCSDWKAIYIDDLFSGCLVHSLIDSGIPNMSLLTSSTTDDDSTNSPESDLFSKLFGSVSDSPNISSDNISDLTDTIQKSITDSNGDRVVSPIRLMLMLRQ